MALDMSIHECVNRHHGSRSYRNDCSRISTAITLYTLVIASLMVLGGKISSIIGPRRPSSFSCIICACGSLTTALTPTYDAHRRLIILEGFGAILSIMPAIVALITLGNFPA